VRGTTDRPLRVDLGQIPAGLLEKSGFRRFDDFVEGAPLGLVEQDRKEGGGIDDHQPGKPCSSPPHDSGPDAGPGHGPGRLRRSRLGKGPDAGGTGTGTSGRSPRQASPLRAQNVGVLACPFKRRETGRRCHQRRQRSSGERRCGRAESRRMKSIIREPWSIRSEGTL
jgi:hypothetical protein